MNLRRRVPRDGILYRGFTIYNNLYTIRIPKGTGVRFGYRFGVPNISFKGISSLCLIRIDYVWHAIFYDVFLPLMYDLSRPPYPISAFE